MPVNWSLEALRDLERIRDYISQDSPEAADKVATTIVRASNSLVAHPLLGRRRFGSLRALVLTRYPYTVYYRLVRGGPRVVAVRHHRQKPPYTA